MSRIPKWKSEKAKVKVVFRLQFHATHIPQTGWDKLFVSLIPADIKKPTAKTNKANVRNGSCKWSDPIYENTSLLQDTRTKEYDEKLYTLVVATGLSRSCLLGEVDINLADFAAALKPSSVELPLHGCDHGTVLHVIVQLLTPKTGFREFEQQRELSMKGFQKISNQRSHSPLETVLTSSEIAGDTTNKVNARVELKEDYVELPPGKEVAESNEDCEVSSAGLDGSSYTSDNLYAEKNELSGEHDIDSFKCTISGNKGGFPITCSSISKKEEHCLPTQGSNEWTCGWNSDYSADNDLATAYEENNMLRLRLEVAESAFLQLKTEANTLQSITDELGAGTQSLAQHLSFELASGKQLMREVSILKSECSGFKTDIGKLKSCNKPTSSFMMRSDLADASFVGNLVNGFVDGDHKVHDLQTKWLQALLLIESKVQEIQRKTFLGYCGNDDHHFLHVDFEVLEFVINNLKQSISQKQGLEGYARTQHFEGRRSLLDSSYQLVDAHDPQKSNFNAEQVMEEKMCELLQKLEESKTEKETLMKEMSHMERYYEGLIEDLKESDKQTMNELEKLRTEYSSCLYTISLLQEKIEKGHQEMNEQLMRFVKDRNSLESQNKELEERVIVLETALRKVRWNYSIAVDSLQKDLELLSSQVLSLYETNQNLAKQAFPDANENFHEEHKGIHKSERITLFLQDPYEPNFVLIQPENTYVKSDAELSALGNVVLDKKTGREIYILHEVQNKELQSKDEACPDEFDSANPLWAGSQHCYRPTKNLIIHADLPPETEKHEIPPERFAILRSDVGFQSIDDAETYKLQLNNENCVEEIKSLCQLKDLYSNMEVELSELHAVNIQWKTFSDIIVETLYGAADEINCMKDRVVELEQKLVHSTDARETLALKLHSALDQTKTLQEDGAKYISRCDDLTLSNQILVAKLKDLSVQNTSLIEKDATYENLMMEWRTCESKYNVCTEERNTLENLLIQESLEKSHLQIEMDSMTKEFKALKEKFNKQTLKNDDFQKIVAHLQGGLNNLYANMISCNRQIDVVAFKDIFLQDNVERKNYADIFSHLEQFQKQACQKILQLHQEREMEEMKNTEISKGKKNFEDEILHLTNIQVSLEDQMDYLRSSRDELEVTNIVLRSKFEEQRINISLLLECDHQLRKLREQHDELTHKLFEQIQRTEEFKNLSIHLREMKNKADAEYNQAREKMEKKGSSVPMQESLRIVFLKEQYESKIQELKNQLYVSSKYAEEVLLKLQNTLDEVELGKKNEVSLVKRIEELSMKISNMETELHMAQIDRRELVNAYDSIKTELQNTILSLDYCKEEKLNLEDSLQECHEERGKMRVELGLVKQLLQNMAASDYVQSEGNHGFFTPEITSIGQHSEGFSSVSANVYEKVSNVKGINSGKDTELAACLDGSDLHNPSFSTDSCGDDQDLDPDHIKESAHMSYLPYSQASENGSKSESDRKKILEHTTVDNITVEEHFREQQRLKAGMELLQKELERLKDENFSSLLPLVDNEIDASQHSLQGALSHLDTVPALELESDEALGAKEETDAHSESSFLKQHNDTEPDSQSFGDTKELIQGMLDVKRRNVAVETELKEMQTRYSQLSLKFAEVEGERQKLVMTLKNRSPKKF